MFCCSYRLASSSSQDFDRLVVSAQLDQRSDGDEIQDYLQQLTGGRSVPRVFIGGKFIGGGDDTVRMKKSGELQAKLADVGAMAA